MTWSFVFQFVWNLITAAAVVGLWLSRKTQPEYIADPNLNSLRMALETRIAQLEEEIRRYGEKAQDQIRTLSRIGDEATRILKRGQIAQVNYAPSAEECELRAALTLENEELSHHAPIARENLAPEKRVGIPTLTQLENTRQRLKSEISVDLRTLLKDQLA